MIKVLQDRALVACASFTLAMAVAQRSDACGGTFCDSGPQAMPVDQTGENILFATDGTTVEAHIQIQYEGEAAKFAWVLPLPAVPELRVGSQLLFQSLLASTVPIYGFNTALGCNAGTPPPALINGGGGVSFDPVFPSGPEVVLRETVGAFDVTVLSGGTAQEVSDWLDANGYQSIATAPAILEDYVAQNFVFAAVKLTGGAGVDEIHPLVVRYAGSEPCVPLKLTAVAAAENMGVRTFFLGNERFLPLNFKHVELNTARLDWLNFAPNYLEAVSNAVDSPIADGQAFVTEYAGPSTVVQPNGVYNLNWSAAAFLDLDPLEVIQELSAQGLASCAAASCSFSHPLLLPMLHEFVPVPDGVDEGAFYSCIGCYRDQLDTTAWDGAEGDIPGRGFAEAFQERIVLPGRDATDLLAAYPYLTRMFTTISPAEMTLDPTFAPNSTAPDVASLNVATQRLDDEGRAAFELVQDHKVVLAEDGTWPVFDGLMPWASRITEFQADGTTVELVDNDTLVSILLDEWNGGQSYDDPNCTPTGSFAGGGGAINLGRGGAGGAGGTANAYPSSDDGGCGCRTASNRSQPLAWALLALISLGFAGRRRARNIV